MTKWIARLSGTAALLAAACIIGFAVIVTLGHLFAPLAANYRSEAEQALSKALGQRVEIKNLQGRWQGYGPQLILRNISIHSDQSGASPLNLPEVRISVSLISSLIQGELIPRRVTLISPHLEITRGADNQFRIGGIKTRDGSTGDSSQLLLPAHIKIRNGTLVYNDQTRSAQPLRLSQLNLSLRSDDERHQLDLAGSLSGDKRRELRAVLDLRSHTPDQLSSWNASFHINASSLPLEQIVEYIPEYPHQLPLGTSSFSAWGQISEGRLQQLSGNLSIDNLLFKLDRRENLDGRRALALERVGGEFLWQHNSEQWSLDIVNLQVVQQQREHPASRLKLLSSNGRLKIAIDHFTLAEVRSLMTAVLPAEHQLLNITQSIQPEGGLRDLRVEIPLEQPEQWRASGNLSNLSTVAWGSVPGIQQLSADFWLNPQSAQLQLSGRITSINFNELFRDPLELQNLEGSVYWQREGSHGWRLYTHDTTASNEDIQTRTRFLLQQPDDPQQPLFLDLQSDYRDGDGSTTSRYLPTGIMGEEVVAWLDRSIGSGRVSHGSVVVRGPLADFPYHETYNGRFEVLFRVEQLNLDYWPEWPPLSNISADVRFLGNRLDIWLDQADILNSKVEQAHGWINDLALTSPFELTGLVSGPLTDNLRLLSESPLKQDFGPMVADLDGSGTTRLALDFAIQIDDKGDERLDGQLSFLDAQLTLKSWDLLLTDIQGELKFDQDSIQGDGLSGKIMGHPIRVDVSTPQHTKDYTRISAQGEIGLDKIQQRFPQIDLLSRASGASHWLLDLDIPHLSAGQDQPVRIAVSSSLEGIAVDLPSPLGKLASQKAPLNITTELGQSKQQRYHINYDQWLDANLLADTGATASAALSGVNIVLGGKAAGAASSGELEITGQLQQLVLDPWFNELGQQPGQPAAFSLKRLEVGVNELEFKKISLKHARVDLQRQPDRWSAHIQSDRLAGRLTIPADLERQSIELELDQLKLDYNPERSTADSSAEATATRSLDPYEMPAFKGRIKQLSINGHPFGSLSLTTEKSADGLSLKHFDLNSDSLQIDASGYWTRNSLGQQQTGLDATLSTTDTGTLLTRLGFAKNLNDAPLDIEAHLVWPNTPIDFHRSTLSGQASLLVGKGQFLEVDPGVGRIFGLLNLTALQRRLTLDFSDIFNKGFAFDRIEGNFLLDSGDAYTNDFAITGPSANIEIAGRIGLSAEDMDQQISVTPKISSTLPLAGTLAGGPAVGAALLLAQKIFGDTLDKVVRIKYTAIGPWDNPTITQVKSEASEQAASSGEYDPSTLTQPTIPPSDTEWQLPPVSSIDTEAKPIPKSSPEPAPQTAHEPTPAEEQASTTPQPGTDEQPAEEEKKSGFFSKLLKKIKPTKPAYPEQREQTLPGQ